MGKFVDLIGKKFSRLTVIKRMENDKYHNTKWLCRCECGNEVVVYALALRSGDTCSCGCLRNKHGLRKSRLYRIWQHIKERCYKPNTKCYNNYGGRGIKMYQEWLDDFMNFYEWAMSNGYKDDLTIDRIDVNGNYEPSNCRWVTQKVQARNTRVNNYITYNGETKCVAEWAEIYNIKPATLSYRLHHGWNIEKALTLPIDYKNFLLPERLKNA